MDCTQPGKEQNKQTKHNQLLDKGKGKIMEVVVKQDDVEDWVVQGTILIKNI